MPIVTTDSQNYTDIANAIRSKNGTDTTYTPSEMSRAISLLPGGDMSVVIEELQAYTDEKVAEVIGTASADLDTLGKLESGLNTHIDNKNNPHEVNFSQLNTGITLNELGCLSGTTGAIQTQLNNKLPLSGGTIDGALTINNNLTTKGAVSVLNKIELQTEAGYNHGGYIDFHYNGSTADYTSRIIENSSGNLNIPGKLSVTGGITANVSGNASTASALTTSAGSNTKPVYFSNGIPVATSYDLSTFPSKTGSGASGTWAINISGSSASCTGNAKTATTAASCTGNAATASSCTGNAATATNLKDPGDSSYSNGLQWSGSVTTATNFAVWEAKTGGANIRAISVGNARTALGAQKKIAYGTSLPSSGSEGDVFILIE